MPEYGPRECPLCGGSMKLKQTQRVTVVPGNPKPITTQSNEWVCPDCDYFEEDERENA